MAANIPVTLSSWSTTAGSNQPDSTDLASTLREDLQAIQAAVRYLRTAGTIASASTTDLATKSEEILSVSGTTTITALGTVSAGMIKTLVFEGALTFTHNGTSLILPTAANITTAAGDVAVMLSLGSGNWRCIGYEKASGQPVNTAVSVASVATSGDANVSGTGRFGNDPPISTGGSLIAGNNATSTLCVAAVATNANYNTSVIFSGIERAATNGCNLYIGISDADGTPDTEFFVRGDGLVAGDQAYQTGADYAEMFEWADGGGPDRVGRSVCLDNGKIRVAKVGDDPIGVISVRPTVVGDAAELRWNGRYLHDDFGAFIMEQDPETGGVRRKQNPAWDKDATYVPRMQRKEWAAVGMVGKLRVRKGEVIGARWIKLRDISASVEEWLVR